MTTRPAPHEPHPHDEQGWVSALALMISLVLLCVLAVFASAAAPWS